MSPEAMVYCTVRHIVRHIVRHSPPYVKLFCIDATVGLQAYNSIWRTSDIQRIDFEILTSVRKQLLDRTWPVEGGNLCPHAQQIEKHQSPLHRCKKISVLKNKIKPDTGYSLTRYELTELQGTSAEQINQQKSLVAGLQPHHTVLSTSSILYLGAVCGILYY